MLIRFNNSKFGVFRSLTLILLVQTIILLTASAQSPGELEVFGRIEQSLQEVGNGEIRIVHNGVMINSTQTNSRGRFSFRLPLESEYIVEFTAPGLVTKRLHFDTKLEGRNLRRNYFEFDLVIELFQEIDGIDFSFFEEPLASIGFIDEVDKFFFREHEASPRLRRANEIHLQVVDLIRRRELYATTIQQADQYFQGQSYQLARDAYVQASGLLPEETYPLRRIEEIDQILAEGNVLDRQYNNLIADADRDFAAGLLREAREKYVRASELKPEQEYPKQRISEIDLSLAQEQERHIQYNRLIRLGDESFNARNYEAARPHYESALSIRPAESYPVERIREIDLILADAARIDREYNTYITRGDLEFAQGRLEQSKQSYLSALGVKPSEAYPRSRIEEIDRLIAERELRSRQEQERLAQAQRLEQERMENERREEQVRLAEQQRIEREAREREEEERRIEAERLDREHQAAVQRRLEQERIAEQQRLEQERLANERRREQELLAQQQRIERERVEEQQRLEAQRQERERIEAERRQLEQDRLAQEQRREQESMAEERRQEQLRVAEQLRLQREMEEEQRRIEAERLERERLAEQQRRLEQERLADQQRREQEQLAAARIQEQEALERQRREEELRMAAQLKAEQDALEAKYNDAIQAADRAFTSRVYTRAAELYREAIVLKPQEQYPKTRLAETMRIMDQINRESQSYASIIETANSQFNQRQYTEARVNYTRASEMRPAEQLPRQRIAEIDRILAEELGENARFQNAVRDGDRLFAQRQFFGSRDAYQLALSFRHDDRHSINRIIEINSIIAQSEEMAAFYARGHMDVTNVREMVKNNLEKRFYFVPFDQRRTGSFLMVKGENTSGRNISLFINYGKDNQRSGGFSVTVGPQDGVADLRINISDQFRWISEDNNWISITPVGGEIDLQSIKIHFGS